MRSVQKKKLVITVVVLGIAVLTGAAALIGCGNSAEAAEESKKAKTDSAAVKVVVSAVAQRPFEAWGSFSADLRGVEDAVLTAPYQGGRIDQIKPVGTRFAAGDALCGIDTGKYEAALEAAKAQVEVTKGDLERAKINVEKGSLGKSAVDGANLAYQNARMVMATAKRAYEDCRCQAPFDGVLVSSMVDKYQTVTPGMPTIRLSRLESLEAIIALPEAEAFGYSKGMKATFALLQHPGREFDGEVTTIDQAVDSRSRTVSARITVRNRDGLLKPGMVGRARILRKRYEKAIVIPSTALLHLENGLAVMVAQGGTARQHAIQTGATAGDSTLVTSGLAAGDTLIVTGAFQVSEGTKIQY
jgi:membrane fusion protein (multidrug efflux system)